MGSGSSTKFIEMDGNAQNVKKSEKYLARLFEEEALEKIKDDPIHQRPDDFPEYRRMRMESPNQYASQYCIISCSI